MGRVNDESRPDEHGDGAQPTEETGGHPVPGFGRRDQDETPDQSPDQTPDAEQTKPLGWLRQDPPAGPRAPEPQQPNPSWVPPIPPQQAPRAQQPSPDPSQPPLPAQQPSQQPGQPPGPEHTTAFPVAGYPAYPVPQPGPQLDRRHATPRARVSGWVWPVVAVLALVVGVIGGVMGSVGYLEVRDDDGGSSSAAPSGRGLDDLDTATEAPLTADDGTVANVAAAVLPSTVQILAEFEGQAGGATGSGFVLDRDGHVITNNHVVADAASDGGEILIVGQDGSRYPATVVGRSPVYDLAVLLSEEMSGQFEPAALGASQKLRVGETVVAIGSPLGLSSTVTAGIVSALQRPVTTGDSDNESSYINAVQTDAAINPGNSGGPLVNLLGQVVGVNSAIATTGGGFGGEAGSIGVGFAIPVEQVRVTADQILRTGEARYPVIGAQVQVGGQSEGIGAVIEEVVAGSPAEAGGLQDGDVITAVDGDLVTDGISLIVSIRTRQEGDTVTFTVDRSGSEAQVDVVLDGQVG